MFDDVLGGLRQTKEAFNEKIQDAFGRSIDKNVFIPIDDELNHLESAYSEAEIKIQEIQTLTIELRMIL